MATCTVKDVLEDAAYLLGDSEGDVFNVGTLSRAFGMAYRELYDCLGGRGLSPVHKTVTVALAANTPSSTFGLTDMGEPDALWERGAGEVLYAFVAPVDSLPQWGSSDKLRVWKRESETFYFVPATTARELKIEYFASGAAPAAGDVGIDNARSFLASRTASIAAANQDMPSRADELKIEAFGPSRQPDGSGGALRGLIGPMILEQQGRSARAGSFRARRNAGLELY